MNAQILALGGVFQATELVRQAAAHGAWSGYAATASLESLFRLEAETPEEIYGDVKRLRLGLETLIAVLSGEAEHQTPLQCAVTLLQLEKKFLRHSAMMDKVGEGLARIEAQTEDMEDHQREEKRAEQVAQLYTETVSTLTPRVVVNGNPQQLQNPRNVYWIRALLFSGLRSAVLWEQVGGGRFNLLFGRKRLLRQAEAALNG